MNPIENINYLIKAYTTLASGEKKEVQPMAANVLKQVANWLEKDSPVYKQDRELKEKLFNLHYIISKVKSVQNDPHIQKILTVISTVWPTSFSEGSIPPEILGEIFSHLSEGDIKQMETVSKKYRQKSLPAMQFCAQATLKKVLEFLEKKINPSCIEFIRKIPCIASFGQNLKNASNLSQINFYLFEAQEDIFFALQINLSPQDFEGLRTSLKKEQDCSFFYLALDMDAIYKETSTTYGKNPNSEATSNMILDTIEKSLESKHFKKAVELAKQLKFFKYVACEMISTRLIDHGNPKRAFELINEINHSNPEIIHTRLIRHLILKKHYHLAFSRIQEKVTLQSSKDDLILEICEEILENNPELALKFIQGVSPVLRRDGYLIRISKELVKKGNFKGAISVLPNIMRNPHKEVVLKNVFQSLVLVEKFDEALDLIKFLPEEVSIALQIIVETLIEKRKSISKLNDISFHLRLASLLATNNQIYLLVSLIRMFKGAENFLCEFYEDAIAKTIQSPQDAEKVALEFLIQDIMEKYDLRRSEITEDLIKKIKTDSETEAEILKMRNFHNLKTNQKKEESGTEFTIDPDEYPDVSYSSDDNSDNLDDLIYDSENSENMEPDLSDNE